MFDEASKILCALELDDAKSSWLLMFLSVVTSKLELATQNWLIRSWYSFCFSLQFTINVFWSDWSWFYIRLIIVMSVSLMFLFEAKINLIKTELLVNIWKKNIVHLKKYSSNRVVLIPFKPKHQFVCVEAIFPFYVWTREPNKQAIILVSLMLWVVS